ncbi:MAG: UTP--glucose-1-phosphate uridylyltransferase [Firmicutes bacterium]|nr:UTP--glucose-1-phosphate uridylyltransferase [Bacillota bacterium]
MKVKKAIIPAGGLGTRFLPITKSVSKEMLPILDKPALQIIIEELVAAGITDIYLVIAQNKYLIKQHFSECTRIESALASKQGVCARSDSLLKEMRALNNLANIHYIIQEQPKGLADAIYLAKNKISEGNYKGDFLVALGDNILLPSKKSDTANMLLMHSKKRACYISVKEVCKSEISKYGCVQTFTKAGESAGDSEAESVGERARENVGAGDRAGENGSARESAGGLRRIKHIIEKPTGEAPSNLAVFGRYIFPQKIFEYIEQIIMGQDMCKQVRGEQVRGREIQAEPLLTDAINILAAQMEAYTYLYEQPFFDIGCKLGYLKANVQFGIQHPETKDGFISFIKNLCENI